MLPSGDAWCVVGVGVGVCDGGRLCFDHKKWQRGMILRLSGVGDLRREETRATTVVTVWRRGSAHF